MKDIFSLRLYTRVARLGSFSAAARECGLSQSQASRLIADLEASLGVRLLTRTTRAVVPTEAGSDFLVRMESVLAALEDAEHSVREGGELRGILRMSMPTSIGVREVIPRLSLFAERHPALVIQTLLEDRRQDLVRDAVDVAIRVGRLPDSTATAKQLLMLPRVIIGSPAYFEKASYPKHPSDLSDHRIVGGSASAVPTAWTFTKDEETLAIDLTPHFTTNDNEGAVAAVTAGLGITSTTAWGCRREIADGSLVRILTDWKTVDVPVHAYFPMGKATRAAGRAVAEFLHDEFLTTPPLPAP